MEYKNKKYLKIVMIDSSSGFNKSMLSQADSRGIDLTCFESVDAMGSVGKFREFDVAIVECDEGVLTGLEVAVYLSTFMDDMPLVLVSDRYRPIEDIQDDWPKSVKGFVHKLDGANSVLDFTLSII